MITKDSVELLRRLTAGEVDSIVVGMAAAVLQGVPLTTRDLDIVHCRTHDNVARLLSVLAEVDAVARGDSRRTRPGPTHLLGPGHVLTETRFGDLDCLGAIDGGRTYEDLQEVSIDVDFEGRSLRVLTLEELVAVKKRAGRPKDLAVIPYIESTIDEVRRRCG